MKLLFFLCALSSLLAAAEPLPLMQNLDGDLSFTGSTPQESLEKLQQLVDDIASGPAKELMWSIGAGSDILYYPTKVASTWGWRRTKSSEKPEWKVRIERCRAAIDAGLDAPRIVGERARDRGLRFLPSYRMNDAHYCSDPLDSPLTGRFWMEHQDAELGKSPVAGYDGYRHLLNFARADVRAYRLAVIFEAMDRYADLMDGFELDCNRFQIFFPPGEATQNAHHLTALLEEARRHLDAVAAAQKRSMRLIVRVPPSLKNCAWSGLEVEDWMKRHLIDALIPAQTMTLAHDMPLDEFVTIAKPAGCDVIGSLYGRAGYNWPFSPKHEPEAYSREVSRAPTPAQFLGVAFNQRWLGVASHQFYNYLLHTDAETVRALTTLQGTRRYQVTQAYFHDCEDTYEYRKQLPAALKTGERVCLRLLIGETPGLPAYLRLGLCGANRAYADVALTVQMNGQAVHEGPASGGLVVTTGKRHGKGSHPPPTEAYLQWPVPRMALPREGWNSVDVTLTAASKPLQLVETEIAICP